jgi:Hemerythrin HHE cation binding domain
VGAFWADRRIRLSADHDTRDGWPAELLFLLDRHPRATWPARREATVAFWLDVHDHLRRDCVGLEMAADDYAARRTSAAQFAAIAAPRLRGLIAGLHGHHQIEDFHYFPAFRRAEPRLAWGFDRLENEHAEIAREVNGALAALVELRTAGEHASEPGAAATLALAAERYIGAARDLCRSLCRHLTDEETLVVPLLIERGDDY